MKNLYSLLFVLVFSLSCLGQSSTIATLTKVERITKEESNKLSVAYARVQGEQNALKQLKEQIAEDHGFSQERYMEWSSWYEFNGDYILGYHSYAFQNLVTPPSFTLANKCVKSTNKNTGPNYVPWDIKITQ